MSSSVLPPHFPLALRLIHRLYRLVHTCIHVQRRVPANTASVPHVYTAQLPVYVLVPRALHPVLRSNHARSGRPIAVQLRPKFQPTCHRGCTKEGHVDIQSKSTAWRQVSLVASGARKCPVTSAYTVVCAMMSRALVGPGHVHNFMAK